MVRKHQVVAGDEVAVKVVLMASQRLNGNVPTVGNQVGTLGQTCVKCTNCREPGRYTRLDSCEMYQL